MKESRVRVFAAQMLSVLLPLAVAQHRNTVRGEKRGIFVMKYSDLKKKKKKLCELTISDGISTLDELWNVFFALKEDTFSHLSKQKISSVEKLTTATTKKLFSLNIWACVSSENVNLSSQGKLHIMTGRVIWDCCGFTYVHVI